MPLEREGRPVGFASPPVGTSTKQPVLVAVHGAGDRPDWECSAWRAIAGPRPFIVCPQGVPHPKWPGTFVWSGTAHVEQAIDSAMRVVETRFGRYIAAGPRVFAGFSQGAVIGADVVRRNVATYPFALFQEGLGDVQSPAFAKAFTTGGGKRIVLGCSQGGCSAAREGARRALSRGHVEARVNDAGPIGHTMDDRVIASVRRDITWLLEGDATWAEIAADHAAVAR